MKLRWMLGLVAVVALAACNGEKATITGQYGSAVLVGQAVIVDMENTNPAGVEVGVRGTGMHMTLGSDGQFVFSGVPQNAELTFFRADGINGSVATEGSGRVVVELGKNGAKKKSNPSSGQGKRLLQFEGLVRSATADQLVLFTSHKEEVTIKLTPDTIIRKGGTVLDATALLPDTRVHVKAMKVDDVFEATLVIIQNDDDDGEKPEAKEYEGLIRSVSDTQLVVFTSHGEEVTFVLNADTVIRKGNTTVPAVQLEVGNRVHVRASTAEDGTKTALLVIVQNEHG